MITQVDGAPVTTDTQLQREILKKKVGQKVELGVWRKGQTMQIEVTTGALPDNPGQAAVAPSQSPDATRPEETNKFGLQVQDLTKEMAARLKLKVQQGVVVTDVADNSIAAAQDIRREDVITMVANHPVTDVASFRAALAQADPTHGILLYLDRKGSKTFAVLKAGGGN
ncbi:MAG: PDZ domain-containing protein [Chthoniobacterales bacterium]